MPLADKQEPADGIVQLGDLQGEGRQAGTQDSCCRLRCRLAGQAAAAGPRAGSTALHTHFAANCGRLLHSLVPTRLLFS